MIHIIEFTPDLDARSGYPIELKSAIVKFYEWQTLNKNVEIISIQKDGTAYIVAYKKVIEKREGYEKAVIPQYDVKNAKKKL